MALVPVVTFLTIVWLFGLQKSFTRFRIACLFAIPVLMIIVDATNSLTSWFISSSHIIDTAGFSSLALDYGPAFLIHTAIPT